MAAALQPSLCSSSLAVAVSMRPLAFPPLTPTLHSRTSLPKSRLLQEGTFFSDEAMRERQPYLHHQWVGQFRPPGEGAGPSGGGEGGASGAGPSAGATAGQGGDSGAPGVPLSQSILRHQDELEAMLAARAEAARYEMVEEESESDDEEQQQGGAAGGSGAPRGAAAAAAAGGGRRGGGGAAGAEAGGEEEEEEDPGYIRIPEAER